MTPPPRSLSRGQFELRQLDDPAPTLPAKREQTDATILPPGKGAARWGHDFPVVGAKKAHVAEETFPEPTCAMCALLCKTGRAQNPKAKQLGIMIMAASSRLDQLWDKCTPTMVMGWLSKIDGLSVQDRVENNIDMSCLLKAAALVMCAMDGRGCMIAEGERAWRPANGSGPEEGQRGRTRGLVERRGSEGKDGESKGAREGRAGRTPGCDGRQFPKGVQEDREGGEVGAGVPTCKFGGGRRT
eukprot:gene4353-14473_t